MAYSCESEGIYIEQGIRAWAGMMMKAWNGMCFPLGEEPTVYTAADLCAEVGHEHCERIDRNVEGSEGEPVFCICWCHRFVALEPN